MRKREPDPIRPEHSSEAVDPKAPAGGATPPDITAYLRAWEAEDPSALDELVPRIYDELRCLARRQLSSERSDHTLQPTALIHEAYLRLKDARGVHWESRAHFFAAVTRLMRQILVDHARRRQAAKRGGKAPRLALADEVGAPPRHGVDLLALDVALSSLAALDPRQARIVELRFFAGLTVAEVAAVLGVGSATVERDWRVAKAWLLHELRGR